MLQFLPFCQKGFKLIRSVRNLCLIALTTLLLSACSLGQQAPTATESDPARTPTVTVSGTESPEPIAPTRPPTLSPTVRAEMEELEQQVISLRGLLAQEPVERRLITGDVLATQIQADLLENYPPEQAAEDARLLSLFGLLPADFDLWAFYSQLYSEQVAGYYDDEQGALFIVVDTEFDGPERLSYVHEYAHALQDQHYDFDQGLGFDDDLCELDGDRCAAIQALVEGDASLLEEQWLRTFASQADLDELVDFYGQFQSPTFDQAPSTLRESFLFPYREGLEFVRWYFQRDGWSTVDELYADPPASTEMILHPLRYPDDDPVQLQTVEAEPAALGSGWRLLEQGTLGEFDFQQLLAQWLPAESAEAAAAGWAGDRFVAYFNDDRELGAWYIIHQWDTIRDAQDTYLTWRDYGEARFGPRIPDGRAYEFESEAGFARLELESNQTLWLVAPEAESLEALRGTIQFPADD